MKLWLVGRTDETDWDETHAILVRAESEQDARTMALADDTRFGSDTPAYPGFRPDNLVITEITPDGKPEVILVDFLRG